MTLIQSYCGDFDCDEPFNGTATHPPCEHRDGMTCEPCNALTEIEAQIEDLHSQLKDLHERHCQARVSHNHVHSPIIHQFPLETVAYIFTLVFPPRDTPPCCTNPERASPLILAKICHTWRVLALSTPRLWCDISVNAANPNFLFLNHQIAHSGMVPLSIHLFALSSDLPISHRAKQPQAMSFVIKQLHRTASFFIQLPDRFLNLLCCVSDVDYQKAAPLLDQLHVHCNEPTWDDNFPLRFAIEPPRPRRVSLGSLDYNHILVDWSHISSATLYDSNMPLPILASTKDLKHLSLRNYSIRSAEQPLVVNQSIQELTLETLASAHSVLTATSLPSLRVLEIHVIEMHTLAPILCHFLRRSLCPLEVLTLDIFNLVAGSTIGDTIHALTDILENTANTLQQLFLRFTRGSEFTSSSFELLVQRFNSSQDKSFLPCLQMLCITTYFVPPFGLLLDVISADNNHSSSEIIDTDHRPLNKLTLEVRNPRRCTIPQDDLLRILQLRAAGKTISITCSLTNGDEPYDVVKYSKWVYCLGEG